MNGEKAQGPDSSKVIGSTGLVLTFFETKEGLWSEELTLKTKKYLRAFLRGI